MRIGQIGQLGAVEDRELEWLISIDGGDGRSFPTERAVRRVIE
jgi:hypothetical protein